MAPTAFYNKSGKTIPRRWTRAEGNEEKAWEKGQGMKRRESEERLYEMPRCVKNIAKGSNLLTPKFLH